MNLSPADIPAVTGLKVLVPTVEGAPWVDDPQKARSMTTEPFAAARIGLLDTLSRAILGHPRLRRDPAGVALGFWLRRANITRLEAEFRQPVVPGRRVPAGLVFHIAPANVDTMFLYSWALSFLGGNANVVRLTSQSTPLMDDLLQCLQSAFSADPAASRGNAFVTYGHDETVTTRFSLACDTRIVWGGDETVRRLRAIPLSPHAAERSFASKRSLSVIGAHLYEESDDVGRGQLAERMAADLLPFAQMACSSPHAICWLGDEASVTRARPDFVGRLELAMRAKQPEADMALAVRRLNHAFSVAADGGAAQLLHQPASTHVVGTSDTLEDVVEHCGGGFLTHRVLPSLSALAPLLTVSHQTITYAALSKTDVEALASVAGPIGVDRIVPVGRALDFAPFWDGFNLWGDLTRVMVVQ